ncbi:hypothetical protein [Rivihabitans pingtungensis]|uniref:hypothetical protein n=1 Tax=Rivihabitans pingtungensis TaxID=1054498 RepID=UPI002357802F|nr:hypothetical protein [Rivihabitans pingtungensis]MCK6437454.1 hypothetical protein [Rivihabitans pingtungensis]
MKPYSRRLALTLWLSVATLTGTRLWCVYPDFTPPFPPAFGVWLVTVLHWPKGDVELALALCCSFVATLSLTLLAWALWRMWCRR